MFVELKAFVSDWFLTKTDYNRFIEIENLKDILETQELKASLSGELSKEFLEDCQNLSQDKPILVVGSLYLVGAVLNLLKDDYESLLPLKNLEAFSNETR
jgi:dihydrofolate synthase/folylpolyglutamate synthase